MSLLPVVDVDRKPFPFPVSETAAVAYGFGDGGTLSSAADTGLTSNHFVAASPLSWHRLPQPDRSWYHEPCLDQSDCNVRSSRGYRLPVPPTVTGTMSARLGQPSYGHRTADAGEVNGGLFLSHSSNGLSQTVRNDSSLPAYLSNAGKSQQLCIFDDKNHHS